MFERSVTHVFGLRRTMTEHLLAAGGRLAFSSGTRPGLRGHCFSGSGKAKPIICAGRMVRPSGTSRWFASDPHAYRDLTAMPSPDCSAEHRGTDGWLLSTQLYLTGRSHCLRRPTTLSGATTSGALVPPNHLGYDHAGAQDDAKQTHNGNRRR